MVVGGNDAERLAAFIKTNLPLIHKSPKIALGNNLSPKKRAALLNQGFDDVLNMKNSTHEEFAARTLSIFERYRLSEIRHDPESSQGAALAKIADMSKLTFAQRKILEALSQAPEGFCTLDKLCRAASRDYSDLSDTHLRVLIHKIRTHLKPDCSIVSVYGEGYRLVKPR